MNTCFDLKSAKMKPAQDIMLSDNSGIHNYRANFESIDSGVIRALKSS
jgi:hypothetical protein